jgi:hypothetical protein
MTLGEPSFKRWTTQNIGSRKLGRTLNVASESARDGSVYDIIYSDTRRLSSLLSQFSDDGVVTELTRQDETAHSNKAGLSIKVLSGDTSSSGREAKSQKIDPQWLLPLLFLDEAEHLIERDIAEASIGSLILITGKLILTDVRILQKLWSAPSAKKVLLQQMKDAQKATAAAVATASGESDISNRATRRAAGKAGKASANTASETNEAELLIEMLPLLPHSPQINLVSPDHVAWATIEPDSVLGSVEDLMLKHGAKIAGSWSIVGILDARPFETRDDEDYDDFINVDEHIRTGMFQDNLWKIATELAAPARQALGRPFGSYGVTPLVIFREIEQPAAAQRIIVS